LLNPWVRTSEGQAEALLQRYYRSRLRSQAFWRKLAEDPSTVLRAGREYFANRCLAAGARFRAADRTHPATSYVARMLAGAQGFPGRMLILLSGQDLVAAEFALLVNRSRHWRQAVAPPKAAILRLPEATHTFARRVWRDWVAQRSAEFIRE
jgi:hypothetical protein